MFKKVLMAVAGLAVLGFGVVAFGSSAATASAEEPPMAPAWCVGAPGDDGPYDRPWLRHSIVDNADTIGVPNQVVLEGLQHGLSLNQIAFLNGVSHDRLEAGMLLREANDLRRLVANGQISRDEALQALQFVRLHIDEIVSHHFDCLAEPES